MGWYTMEMIPVRESFVVGGLVYFHKVEHTGVAAVYVWGNSTLLVNYFIVG